MHQLPYQSDRLPVLASIMYVFCLDCFAVCIVTSILRWTLFTQAATLKTVSNIDEISFLGAPPTAFLTLVGLTGLIVSNSYWSGHA